MVKKSPAEKPAIEETAVKKTIEKKTPAKKATATKAPSEKTWDGTLRKGIKVCWMGGHNSQLSRKYFGIMNCATRVWGKVNSELEGKISEVESNWKNPEKVPKAKELKEMKAADIVVKGSWFTRGDEKEKTMAEHSLKDAEEMGACIVDEEAFYVAMVGEKKD